MPKKIQKRPMADMLIQSMRSMGYTFESAVCDIVDNSISANAKNIDVYFRYESNPYLAILDDGVGMTAEVMENAMRYGSQDPHVERAKSDLGRFGLGMKSASLSQCRLLTVVSKRETELNAYSWDLDVIEQEQDWILLQHNATEIMQLPYIEELMNKKSGTMIIWQRLDRIETSTASVSKSIALAMTQTSGYMALIYHRFLGKDLKISVNNHQLESLDPFLENHPSTTKYRAQEIRIDGQVIRVKPYVLPHLSRLDKASIEKLGELASLKNQQGFYLYRNKRLIIWGTWFRMSGTHELGKLARIQVDIPNTLDQYWNIDIKKSSAQLPDFLRKQLLERVKESLAMSEKIFAKRVVKEKVEHEVLWNRFKDKDNKYFYKVNQEHSLVSDFIHSLDDDDKHQFRRVLYHIESNFPYTSAHFDESKGNISKSFDGYEQVVYETIETFISRFLEQGLEKSKIKEIMMKMEPMRAYPHLIEKALEVIE